MTALTAVRAAWGSVLSPQRRSSEEGWWIATFPIVDTFEGEVTDPQSLHKYLYCHANPIEGTDPTGESELMMTLGGLSVMGGVAGLVGNFLVNHALNRPLLDNAGRAFFGGAIMGPLAVLCPAAGLTLAAIGFGSSLYLTYEVVSRPNWTASQLGAALTLVALSAWGGYASLQAGRQNGWLINSKALNPSSGIASLEAIVTGIRNRVGELKTQLGDSEGWVVMAVTIARDAAGQLRTIVSTSEPNGYLRPGVQLKGGELLATGSDHAEANGIFYAINQGWEVVATGATRPICGGCITTLTSFTGGTSATGLRYNQISVARVKALNGAEGGE